MYLQQLGPRAKMAIDLPLPLNHSFALSARVLKECSSEISPMLALIYNESLAQCTVPDDWRQANVALVF